MSSEKCSNLNQAQLEEFTNLQNHGKKFAAEGKLYDALHLYELARKICETPKVLLRIKKLKDAIKQNNMKEPNLDVFTENQVLSDVSHTSRNEKFQRKSYCNYPGRLFKEPSGRRFNYTNTKKLLKESNEMYGSFSVLGEIQNIKKSDKHNTSKNCQDITPESVVKFRKLKQTATELSHIQACLENCKATLKMYSSPRLKKYAEEIESTIINYSSVLEKYKNLTEIDEQPVSEVQKAESLEKPKITKVVEDLEAANTQPDSEEVMKFHNTTNISSGIYQRKNLSSEIIKNLKDHNETDNKMTLVADGFYICHEMYEKLYPYQREGVAWLWDLHKKSKGGVLGDDMGLGKTFQVIAFISGLINADLVKRILIIVPKSLIPNWEKEFKKWCCEIPVYCFHGSKKERACNLLHFRCKGKVLLTSYRMIAGNIDSLCNLDGERFVWDYVILDEGHNIKNRTKTTEAVHALPTRNRIVLTGTPVQNNLKELWALFDFAHQGTLLGSLKTFKSQYEIIITRSREKDATLAEKRLGTEMADNLKKLIEPFFLRRSKSKIWDHDEFKINALEKKLEYLKISDQRLTTRKNDLIIWLFMSETQCEMYKNFLHLEAMKNILISQKSPLVDLSILKKICDHPRLLSKRTYLQLGLNEEIRKEGLRELDDDSADISSIESVSDETLIKESGKLKFLISLLENLRENGHKILVFSHFRKILDMVQRILVKKQWKVIRIDGTVAKIEERERRIQLFQSDPSYSVFLLTTQVGGIGITLTAADRVIFDPSWNPSSDAQAVDRAYRIGQLKDVIVYRLITCGSVEEKIYRRQIFKDSLTRQATSHSDPYRYFSKEELKELFTFEDHHYSATQVQLSQMHSKQRKTDLSLDEHIAFLHTLGIFGISDHDLMFTKIPQELAEENERVCNDCIKKRVASAQQLIQAEASAAEESIRTDASHGRPFLEPLPTFKKSKKRYTCKPPVMSERVNLLPTPSLSSKNSKDINFYSNDVNNSDKEMCSASDEELLNTLKDTKDAISHSDMSGTPVEKITTLKENKFLSCCPPEVENDTTKITCTCCPANNSNKKEKESSFNQNYIDTIIENSASYQLSTPELYPSEIKSNIQESVNTKGNAEFGKATEFQFPEKEEVSIHELFAKLTLNTVTLDTYKNNMAKTAGDQAGFFDEDAKNSVVPQNNLGNILKITDYNHITDKALKETHEKSNLNDPEESKRSFECGEEIVEENVEDFPLTTNTYKENYNKYFSFEFNYGIEGNTPADNEHVSTFPNPCERDYDNTLEANSSVFMKNICKELNFDDEVAPSQLIQAESFVLEKSILSPDSCSRSVLESTSCLRVAEGGVPHSNICGLSEKNITFPNDNQIPNYSGIRKNVALHIPIEESLKSRCSPSSDKISKDNISSFPLKQKSKINENLDSYPCNASGLCTPELKFSILQFENTIDKAEFGKVKESLFPEKKEENIHKLFPKLTFNAISPEIERNHKITSVSDQRDFFEKDMENNVVFPNNSESVLKYVDNSHVAHKPNEETVKNLKMINPDFNRHEKSFISDKEFVKENAQVTVLEKYSSIDTAVGKSYNKSFILDNEKIILLPERDTFNDGAEGNSLTDFFGKDEENNVVSPNNLETVLKCVDNSHVAHKPNEGTVKNLKMINPDFNRHEKSFISDKEFVKENAQVTVLEEYSSIDTAVGKSYNKSYILDNEKIILLPERDTFNDGPEGNSLTDFFEKDGENNVVSPNNLETVLKCVDNSHVAHKPNEETVKNSKIINPDINRHEKSFISDKELVKENAQVTVLEEYSSIDTAVGKSYNKSYILGNEKIILLPERDTFNDGAEGNSLTDFFEKDGENNVVSPNNLETVLKCVDNSHVAHKPNEETVKNSKMINPDINRHGKSFISDKEFVKENAQVPVLENYPLIGTAVKESYNKSSILGNEKIVLFPERDAFNDGAEGNSLADFFEKDGKSSAQVSVLVDYPLIDTAVMESYNKSLLLDTEKIVLLSERNTFNDGVEGNSLADNEHKSSHSFKSSHEMDCNILQTSSSASTKQLQTENDPIKFLNQIHEELSLDDEAAGLQVIQAESFNVQEGISSLDVSNELFLESTPIFTRFAEKSLSPSNIYVLPERKTAISNDVKAKDNEEFGKANESVFLKKREDVQRENEITTRNHQTDSFEKDGQNNVDFSNNLENVLKYVGDSHVTDKTNEETDQKLKLIDLEINSYEKSYEIDEIVKGNIQVPVLEENPLITSTVEVSFNKSSVLDTERIVLLPESETSNDDMENNSPVDNKHISLQLCSFENPCRRDCENTLETSSLVFTKKLQNENDSIKLLNENYEEVNLDDELTYSTWRKYCARPTEFISGISSVECDAILQNCGVEETEQGRYNSHSHSSSLLSVGKICRITPLKIMKSNGKWNVSKQVSASSVISFCNKNGIMSPATSSDSDCDSPLNKKKIENKKASVSNFKCSGTESEDNESVAEASSSVDYFTADELENSSYLS